MDLLKETMTREEAKKILPIMQAFAEGKEIEMSSLNGWIKQSDLRVDLLNNNPRVFRIKPEPKYRPFKDAEECWNEMLKHKPFGWVNSIAKDREGEFPIHTTINELWSCTAYTTLDGNDGLDYDEMFKQYIFVDGAVFGIEEKE